MIPLLEYADVDEAIGWLERAFGFRLRLRIGNHRAQMHVETGTVVLTEQVEGGLCSVMVRVADVDSHCARAGRMGARIVSVPADYAYGERQYCALDLAGHRWHFSQSIADVDPGEWGGVAGDLG